MTDTVNPATEPTSDAISKYELEVSAITRFRTISHVINTKADEADDTEFHNLCK